MKIRTSTIRLLCAILLFVVSIVYLTSAVSSCENIRWYVKRNGKNTPKFPPVADSFAEYDAYFIDMVAAEAKEKKLYLTFDVGYENGNVERILDTLKAENVSAAFFVLDNIILKNTDLVRRMADEGHLVCNHTKNHKNLSNSTEEEISKNLAALEMVYKEKCDREMSKYFRFPAGEFSISALRSVKNLGYKTVFWSFAYEDWDNRKQPEALAAMKKIMSNTHDGAIILLHPTSKTNADILPELIKNWRGEGYTFCTLDELG